MFLWSLGAWDLELLFRIGRPLTPWTVRRPTQFINEHAAQLHLFVPGMINDVIGFTIGTADERIVTGTDDVVGDGLEDPRPIFVPGIGVGPHDVVGHAVINAVAIVLPAPTAVETIIAPVVLAYAWAFECVPIPVTAVHEPVRFEPLPIRTGTQYGSAFVLKFRHAFHRGDHKGRAWTNAVRRIEKVASVKE